MTIVEKLRARADRRDLSSIAYAADCALDREAATTIELLRENMIYKDAELAQLRCALRVIATGEGAYGAQAHEYKRIARAALGEEK